MSSETEREAFKTWALSDDGGWWPEALVRVGDAYNAGAVTKHWIGWQARAAQAAEAGEALHGFNREDLEAVADTLEAMPASVNVGNVTGEGDQLLESASAYAARFIRAALKADSQGGEKA